MLLQYSLSFQRALLGWPTAVPSLLTQLLLPTQPPAADPEHRLHKQSPCPVIHMVPGLPLHRYGRPHTVLIG